MAPRVAVVVVMMMMMVMMMWMVGGSMASQAFLAAGSCATHTDCQGCLLDKGCGWCLETETCLAGSREKPLEGCCRHWLPYLASCPDECSGFKDCSSCLRVGHCGWCEDGDLCLPGSAKGPYQEPVAKARCLAKHWVFGDASACAYSI